MKIQLTEDSYRLVIDGTPTESAVYGESIECELDGHKYLCLLDIGADEAEEVESSLGSWVYVDGDGVDDVEMEDVDSFDGEDTGDEGDGDDDDPDAAGDVADPDADQNITQK